MFPPNLPTIYINRLVNNTPVNAIKNESHGLTYIVCNNNIKAIENPGIKDKNKVIIMEGFMDLFRAYSVGIKNVVVSMGTAITKEHANLLKRMAKEISGRF